MSEKFDTLDHSFPKTTSKRQTTVQVGQTFQSAGCDAFERRVACRIQMSKYQTRIARAHTERLFSFHGLALFLTPYGGDELDDRAEEELSADSEKNFKFAAYRGFAYRFPMKTTSVPLVIPADLRSQVAKIARKAKAKQAEVYRMAIRCGLPETEKRLVSDAGRLFPNIDPLPRSVLDRWYRSKESKEWDKIEAAATRAQAIPRIEE